MYTQRARRADQAFEPTERRWLPAAKDADGRRIPIRPRSSDAYVAVDEILEDRVRLVVAPWPRLDRDGRLHFSDLGHQVGPFAVSTLQRLVDRHRAEHGQVRRSIRAGDAFLVRGSADRLDGWDYVLDVTYGARAAAKLAMVRAVSPVARPSGRRRGGGTDVESRARPLRERTAGSIALPSV